MKNRYIEVRESKIHNKGIFAAEDIPEGTKIIEYIGEKISKKEGDKRAKRTTLDSKKNPINGAVYIFELNKKYDIDGNVPQNDAKYINHSCNPNCKVKIIQGKIWIVAKRKISKGEELLYNYGYDMEDYHEHECKCGSKNCVGYIVGENYKEELIEKLSEKIKNKISV